MEEINEVHTLFSPKINKIDKSLDKPRKKKKISNYKNWELNRGYYYHS